jgi:hypothetical protein
MPAARSISAFRLHDDGEVMVTAEGERHGLAVSLDVPTD